VMNDRMIDTPTMRVTTSQPLTMIFRIDGVAG
jgi:hypothetical protein